MATSDLDNETAIGFENIYVSHAHRQPSPIIRFDYPEAARETAIGVAHWSTATVDQHGRLSDRSTIRKLEWQPGQSISITPHEQSAVVHTADNGRWRIGSNGYLYLPAAIRHDCNIEPCSRVLIVASLSYRQLVVYPTTLVAIALAEFRPGPWRST
ncbi:hypothetical protein ACFQZZ_25235 [Nocardia sp. GCM10030253]|uniref:hypothetical protein n=1 Tax=Nocardia sp. GCM10030253 TaxID=3273404 RepID=UPI003638B498